VKGRKSFSQEEADEIRVLLASLSLAPQSEQKSIRGKLRKKYRFYISDFSGTQAGFQCGDFDQQVRSGRIVVTASGSERVGLPGASPAETAAPERQPMPRDLPAPGGKFWLRASGSASLEVPVDSDAALLASHIEFLSGVCDHWTHVLIAAEATVLGDVDRASVPTEPGVYVVRRDGAILYIGKSKNLRVRICSQHLGPRKRSSTLRRKVSKHLGTEDEGSITEWLKRATIGWLTLGDHRLTLAVEDHAIEEAQPPFNGYT